MRGGNGKRSDARPVGGYRGCLAGWLLLFAIPIAMADEPPAQEARAPFLGAFLTETRILYPLSIDGWEALGERRYEMAELGASVRYEDPSREDRWMDAYFYPAGVLPSGRLRKDVEQTMHEISGRVGVPDGYERVAMGTLKPFSIKFGKGWDKRSLEAYSVSMQIQRDGKRYHSAMVMLVSDMYYIKTRMTVAEDQIKQERARTLLEKNTIELVRALRVSNTGRCWNPAPILKTDPPLDTGKPGVVVSTAENGVPSAVAYADRVEALEPESPQARLMQLLAGTITGRIGPGCVPAEDMNPPVPEGMRELRFEYSAPKEDSDGKSPRLRGQRTGVG